MSPLNRVAIGPGKSCKPIEFCKNSPAKLKNRGKVLEPFFQSMIIFSYLTSVLLNKKFVRLFIFLANPFFERHISMNLVVLQVVP